MKLRAVSGFILQLNPTIIHRNSNRHAAEIILELRVPIRRVSTSWKDQYDQQDQLLVQVTQGLLPPQPMNSQYFKH